MSLPDMNWAAFIAAPFFSGAAVNVCAAMLSELAPGYVDVSVKRWKEYTGKKIT